MKLKYSLPIAIAISGLFALSAQSAFAGVKEDFNALQNQRMAAVEQATRSIDARYVKLLAPLEQRAARQKNYDLAAEIGKEIKARTPAPIYSTKSDKREMKELQNWLVSHDWTWVVLSANGHPRFHFHFRPKGEGLRGDKGVEWIPSAIYFNEWKVVSPDEFYVKNTRSNYYLYFKVDRRTNTVTLDRDKSAKDHLDKAILYGNQTHSQTDQSNNNGGFFGSKTPQ